MGREDDMGLGIEEPKHDLGWPSFEATLSGQYNNAMDEIHILYKFLYVMIGQIYIRHKLNQFSYGKHLFVLCMKFNIRILFKLYLIY